MQWNNELAHDCEPISCKIVNYHEFFCAECDFSFSDEMTVSLFLLFFFFGDSPLDLQR